MLYKIANVKVSIKTSQLFLDTVYKHLFEKGLVCQNFNNFLVVKSKYTYIIFKTNKNNENHINITKIPSIELISEAIQIIKDLTLCFVISQTIDNIIATTNTNKRLNLKEIILNNKFHKVKYNNEKFPGLFIKFDRGTAIIFHSGKIVIVGLKSVKEIECLLQQIAANI